MGTFSGAAARTAPWLPGLQAERTYLSWARTGLAFLVNGGLLMARHGVRSPSAVPHAAAAVAFALVILTAAIVHHRRRVLARRPLPERLAASGSVLLLSGGTAVLALTVLAAISLG